MSWKLLLFTSFIICAAVACSDKNKIPRSLLQPEKIIPVMWDLTRAETFWETRRYRDSTLTQDSLYKLYARVFTLHKVSKDHFYKSFTWYQQHPDVNKVLMDSLNNMAQRQRQNQYGGNPKNFGK